MKMFLRLRIRILGVQTFHKKGQRRAMAQTGRMGKHNQRAYRPKAPRFSPYLCGAVFYPLGVSATWLKPTQGMENEGQDFLKRRVRLSQTTAPTCLGISDPGRARAEKFLRIRVFALR